MAETCLKCGSQSWDHAFEYCAKCQNSVLHRYCLDIIPDTPDEIVTWYCEDCQEVITPSTPSTEEAYGFGSMNLRDTDDGTDAEKQIFEDGPSLSKLNHMNTNNSMENKQESSLIPNGHDCVQGHLIQPATSNGEIEKVQTSSDFEEHSRLICNTVCEISHLDLPAQPIEDPIWRGTIVIMDKKKDTYDGIVAHISNKASYKVCEEARLLKNLLCFEMHPKSDVWPKSFEKSAPSDENIALYFLPDISSEKVFNDLVDYMIGKDIGLKTTVENAELLLFTSTELPVTYWRFQGKYYLWGVFKAKHAA